MNPWKARKSLSFFVGIFLMLSACKSGTQNEVADSTPSLPLITIDEHKLKVEIVQDPESMAKGLMFVEDLPEDQGMLFVFEATRILSFWMRNTFIPLDIAFIDENGFIVDIQQMQPLDETRNYLSAKPALYALEVNVGWFEKHKLRVGSHVTF